MRIPFPPPPADALSINGYPTSFAASARLSGVTPERPGTSGIPAFSISARLWILSPIPWIASGDGPMNVTPASAAARANPVFSARKPYPGWMASAPVAFAASRIFSGMR